MGKNVNSGLTSCFTTVAQDIKTFLCVLFFFFFLQRLLNMHIYENTLYENLEDLNA